MNNPLNPKPSLQFYFSLETYDTRASHEIFNASSFQTPQRRDSIRDYPELAYNDIRITIDARNGASWDRLEYVIIDVCESITTKLINQGLATVYRKLIWNNYGACCQRVGRLPQNFLKDVEIICFLRENRLIFTVVHHRNNFVRGDTVLRLDPPNILFDIAFALTPSESCQRDQMSLHKPRTLRKMFF